MFLLGMTTHKDRRRGGRTGSAAASVGGFIAANRPAVIVVGVAFTLRVIWLLFAQPTPVSDFSVYQTLAAGLLDHRQLGYPQPTTFYLPVHPVILAAFMLVSRSDLWLGFGMVLVSTATCLLVYVIGRRVFDRESTALTAAAIFAVLPTFVLFSPVLATEHVFVALMLVAVLVAVGLRGAAGWRAVGLGALLGLAVLTRGEAMFYLAAFVVFLWFEATPRRVRIRQLLLMVVGVVAVLSPWYVRNAVVASPDTGLSSGSGINFYFAHNGSGNYGWHAENPFVGMSAEEANREGWRLGFGYLREHPFSILHDVRYGTRQLFAIPDFALFYSTRDVRFPGDPNFFEKDLPGLRTLVDALRLGAMTFLVTAFLAVLLSRRWSRPLVTLLVPLIFLSWVWRTVLFWATPRYGYFILVMLVFFAATTIDTLIRAGRSRTTATA